MILLNDYISQKLEKLRKERKMGVYTLCNKAAISYETYRSIRKNKNKDIYLRTVLIILRALEEPVRQIAENAGLEGSIIIDKVKNSEPGIGYDALNGQYVNMVKTGIVDPTKVTRSALQNAASVSATFLTTEAAVVDIPEKDKPAMPGAPGMGMDGMY